MIDVIRSYEATKPKQHPIGMTVAWPSGSNNDLLNSSADWVSMNGSDTNPAVASGTKVSLWDTDHLCGICGDVAWVWKSLTRGHNPLLMDGYDGSPGVGDPAYNPSDPKWEAIRKNLGYARTYATRMDLAHARPRGDLASSGYCLAAVGSQYLVLLPSGGKVSVNLAGATGSLTVEWFNPSNGQTTAGGTVSGGGTLDMTGPFGGMAVVYIHQ
jgi:Putative collagen-binding domain of a collagenase